MLYQPAAVTPTNLNVVQAPYFGGEFAVYLTTVPSVQVGQIFFTGPGTATWNPNLAVTLPAAGKNLQVTALTPIQALPTDSYVAVQLNATSGANSAITGLAIFAPSGWTDVPGPNFGVGIAFDLVPSTTGATFKAISGLVGASGGSYGLTLGVYALPEMGDYTMIGCTTEIDFNTKSRSSKGVDCRMQTDAFIKAGKTQAGELRIGSKLFSMINGMSRYDGLKCTAMLVGVKDGLLIGDQLVFTEYRPTTKPRLPDGDGEAMHDAEGKFKDHLFFVAP